MKVFLLQLGRLLFWLVLVALGVGGGFLVVMLLFYSPWHTFERLDAEVNRGDLWGRDYQADDQAAVWLYTPFVSPGDPVWVEVGVYRRSLALAITNVKGTFAGQPFQKGGSGLTWGEVVSTSGMGLKRDFVQLELTVPPDARPGEVVPLQMELTCTVALEVKDDIGFRNATVTTPITVPVAVRSPTEVAWGRAGSAGRAFGALGLACLLMAWFRRALRRGSLSENVADKVFTVLVLPAFVGYSWLGYIGFARPLLAALGLPWGWIGSGLVVLWVAAPLLVAIRVKPWDESPSRRPPLPAGSAPA